MKKLVFILCMTPLVALADVNGTFSTANSNVNGTGTPIELRQGEGSILISGAIGGGTVDLEVETIDGSWIAIKTYDTLPILETIAITSRYTVRVNQNGATTPTVYWEIKEAPRR